MKRELSLSFVALLAFMTTVLLKVEASSDSRDAELSIVMAKTGSELETLASRELRRYLYLRMGIIVPILADSLPKNGDIIVIAEKNQALVKEAWPEATSANVAALKPGHYLIKTTIGAHGRKTLLVAGGDSVGALYGAYQVCEKLGVRFYLHGDVMPEQKSPPVLPIINETGVPLFDIRGINPFHDFPEGPDWWNLDDYKSYISQLAKMRMNFIGFHCYPQGHGPEPLVWIGLREHLDKNGNPLFSFPSHWANTKKDGGWGYAAMKTGDYAGGADRLFAGDDYGPDIMSGLMPMPTTPQESNLLFERAGQMFQQAFSYARKLGVKTCIGTETPLTIPTAMQEKLKAEGKDLTSQDVIREVYAGMFERIKKLYPVDYYWLWTPENWTWDGNKPEEFKATEQDLKAAIKALAELGDPFSLATSGWVLGPQHDRTALDKLLPKTVPMSCINRKVGHDPVEPGFSNVTGRPKWSIPWMENDPNLIAPQPWVGRMRYDAVDSLRYGCTGLIGIHWRTKAMCQNVAALAEAAWDQTWVPLDFDRTPVKPSFIEKKVASSNLVPAVAPTHPPVAATGGAPMVLGVGDISETPEDKKRRRSMPVEDFYLDFARVHFGDSVAVRGGELLAGIDGTNMVEPSTWLKLGPGAVKINPTPWAEEQKRYAFVEEFASLRSKVKGAVNLERFDYWLNTYRCQAQIGELGCLRGELDKSIALIAAEKEASQKKTLATKALEIRIDMAKKWTRMLSLQVAAVDTPGELGTIDNMERQSRKFLKFLSQHDHILESALGEKLPPAIEPGKAYDGPARIIVPTVRTHCAQGERMSLKIILLDGEPMTGGSLFVRNMGLGEYIKSGLRSLGRGVYEANFPSVAGDLEYYIEAVRGNGKKLFWPATAPNVGQTIIQCGN